MQRYSFCMGAVSAALSLLTGCASLSPAPGVANIHALVDQRNGVAVNWVMDPETETKAAVDIQQLLSQPLTTDAAVQIALLRNPRIQSEYARLGIAQADVYDASRISNPTLSITALHRSNTPTKFAGGITLPLAELLMLPARKRLATGEYARTQQSIGTAILNLAADTRAAWYTYVGAQQVATMRTAVATAAQTSADVAAKFYAAGNISILQFKSEEAAATLARLQAIRASAEATRARSALNQLMGIFGPETQWTTSDRLLAPLAQDESADALVTLAHQQRLDLAAARQEVTLLEQSFSVTKRYRWLGAVDIGIAGEHETDRTKLYGPSLSLQLPIFNQGQGAIARAKAQLDSNRARVQSLEQEIDANVRLGVDRIATTHRIVEDYRVALIPQRELIVARTQERVNFMLTGVFELLLAKQQEFDAYQGYLEAVRDYWIARVDLMRAVGARLPSDDAAIETTISPDEMLHPPLDDHGDMNRQKMDMNRGAQEKGKTHPAHQNQPPTSPDSNGPTHDQHGEVP